MAQNIKKTHKFSFLIMIICLGVTFSFELNYKNLLKGQDFNTSLLTEEIIDSETLSQNVLNFNDVFFLSSFEIGLIIFLFVFKFFYKTEIFVLKQTVFFESSLSPPFQFFSR